VQVARSECRSDFSTRAPSIAGVGEFAAAAGVGELAAAAGVGEFAAAPRLEPANPPTRVVL